MPDASTDLTPTQIRDQVINQIARECEAKAADAEEYARRYGHLQAVDMGKLYAQARAYREAALVAYRQKDPI